MYSWLSVHVRCSKYLNSSTSIKHRFHPCMDNMARSFPFTIGSPLKMRRKWTANTHQHAHADTHQLAFFYIWPNDIDECRLERIFPCWCVFAGRLVRICHVGAYSPCWCVISQVGSYILNVASYILNVEYLLIWRSIHSRTCIHAFHPMGWNVSVWYCCTAHYVIVDQWNRSLLNA